MTPTLKKKSNHWLILSLAITLVSVPAFAKKMLTLWVVRILSMVISRKMALMYNHTIKQIRIKLKKTIGLQNRM